MGVTHSRMRLLLVCGLVAAAVALPAALNKDYTALWNAIHWTEPAPTMRRNVVQPVGTHSMRRNWNPFASSPPANGGSIAFSRHDVSISGVSPAKAVFDKGCTSTDANGSNACTWSWGDTIGVTLNATIASDVSAGSIEIDAKIDGFIPFSKKCAVCGTDCVITIPVVKKTITIHMPPCPIKAGPYNAGTSFKLPGSDPIPVKTSISGTVKVEAGDVTGSGSFTAEIAHG